MGNVRDCFARLGDVVHGPDKTSVMALIANGQTDGQATRNVLAEAIAEILEVVDLIEAHGGTVQRRENYLQAFADIQLNLLERLHQDRINLNDEISETVDLLEKIEAIELTLQAYPADLQTRTGRELDIDGPVNLDNPQHVNAVLSAMLFEDHQRDRLRGRGLAGLLKGETPLELVTSYEGMQQYKYVLAAKQRGFEDRGRQIDERLRTLFYGERRNPRKLFQDIRVEVPWKIKSTGEGDLYIRRHGKNAGTPFRERQGPNDFAISFDPEVLLPDYMFYLMTYLQPKIAERARGTAQQAIRLEDVNAVLTNHFMGMELFQSTEGTRLQALHNLTGENLAFADKFGGLSSPSIAVLPETHGMDRFGGITLIGSEELGDPQQVPLFDADAYAVRFPRAQYAPAQEADVQVLVDEAGNWSLVMEGTRYSGLPDYIREFTRRRPDADRLIDHMLADNSAKAWYLAEEHGQDPKAKLDDVQPSYTWGWDEGILKFFAGDLTDENLPWEDHRRQKLMRKAGRVVRSAIRAHFIMKIGYVGPEARTDAAMADRAAKVYNAAEDFIARAGIINQDGTLTQEAYNKLKGDAERKGSQLINNVDTRNYLNSRIQALDAEVAFREWVDAKVRGVMGEPRVKIGSRWYPYTLENVNRKMRGKLRGAEGFWPDEGTMRAKASKRIRTMTEARRRALEQIGTPEEVEAARDEARKLVAEFVIDAAGWWPPRTSHLEASSRANDAAREALAFLVQNKDRGSDAAALRKGLERAGFIGPFPDWVIQKGLDAGAAFMQAPVPFFEAKPQRPVLLNEFHGAVIPTDAEPETRAILNKHGIPYIEYEPGPKGTENRAAATRVLQDELSKQGGRTLFQSQIQSTIGFYSGLLNAARTMPQEKGGADQMLATLRKMPGVKQRELEWLGVREYMLAKGTVTRDQLVAFIESGGIRVEEIILGHVSGNVVSLEDVKDAWDQGHVTWGQLLAHMTTDEQAALVRDGRGDEITWETLSDQQKHYFQANLQRQQGTTVRQFGTPEEQKAALSRVTVAQAALTDPAIPIDSPEGRAALREYREATTAIETIAPGWGYADLGDGTYLAQGPEATSYQLAGGMNYREIILKLPQLTDDALDSAIDKVMALYDQLSEQEKDDLNGYYVDVGIQQELRRDDAFANAMDHHDVSPLDFDKAGLAGSEIQRAYAALSALREESMTEFESHVFKKYKNILGWFRVTDRIGPNGERIMFIEETQSDLDKVARKRGVKNLLAIDLMRETLEELRVQAKDLKNDRDPVTNKMNNETLWHRNRDQNDFLLRQLAAEENKAPPFPFGGAAWMELIMKRAIRIAAEQGYDQIAWTTGKQQADRFNLEKVVKSIKAVGRETAEGVEFLRHRDQKVYRGVTFSLQNGRLMTVGVNRAGIIEQTQWTHPANWVGKRLEEVVGEKIAKDILEAKETIEIKGGGLIVGGEGMAKFYDGMLVDVTNRVARTLDKKARVKKFGGGIPHPDAGKWLITDISGEAAGVLAAFNGWQGTYDTEVAAVRAIESGEPREFSLEQIADDAHATVHALDISETMAETAKLGMTFFQDKHRASITFDDQRRGIMRMAKARDLTSYIHESAHLWLENMAYLAEREGASDRAIDNYAKILKFLGVTRRSEITTAHHEQWAKAQELYFQEGKAPTHELQPLFNAFRQWMLRVYQYIRNYFDGIELTDEIREVMDRMVATDEAIANAARVQELRPIFATAQDAGMSPEAFELYREDIEKAHLQSVDEEHRKQLAYLHRETMQWYKDVRAQIQAEVEAEVHGMRVYIALSMLQKGQNPDGTPWVGPPAPFKITKDSLLRAVQGSQAFLKKFPRPYIYTTKPGGVDVDVAANALNYPDAKSMLQDIVTARPMKDIIEFETEQRLNERYPDPMVDGTLAADALISVHNDARAKVLAKELRTLRKLAKQDKKVVSAERRRASREDAEAQSAAKGLLPKRAEVEIIKRLTKDFLSKLRIRDINPNKYRLAEQKAGRLAWQALEKKDYATAYDQKLKQIRSFHSYREAVRMLAESARTQEYLKKFDKPRVKRRLGKAGLLDPILAVIEGIDLRKRSLADVDRNEAMADILAAVEAGNLIVPPATLIKLADVGTNWRNLTVQEFREMRDIVRQLEHMPKREEMARVNDEDVRIADVEQEIAESMLANNKKIEFGVGEETGKESGKSAVKEGVYHALSAGSIARILDAGGWGALTRLLVVPIRTAYIRKIIPMLQQYQQDIAEIYLKHYNDRELGTLQDKLDQKINGFPQGLKKSDILSLALNWGSVGNREAVLRGMLKDEHGTVIGPAYTQQSVAEALALLDARDWAFVQDMWDYIGTYWNDVKDDSGNVIREGLASAEKRRRGYSPQTVEPLEFVINTADGQEITVRGGYMRLIYNPRFGDAVKADDLNEIAKKMGQGLFVSASTRAGSTHERVNNPGRVVRLSLDTLDQHLREVIRDIAIGDEIDYVMRLLNSDQVRAAFKHTNNDIALRELVLWATDSAVGELPANNIWEKMAGWSRVGFTKSKLAFSVTVTVLQITGVFQSMVHIGKKNFMHGFAKFSQNPAGHYKYVMKVSPFMATRYGVMQTYSAEVADAQTFMKSLFGPVPKKWQRGFNRFSHHYFMFIAKAQSLVDVWTWMGAYYDARNNENLPESEAINYADTAVEGAQTSGIFADRSGLERGTLGNRTRQSQYVRLFTTLISYMIRKQGLAYEATQRYKRTKRTVGDAANLLIDYIMLFMVEGVASQLIYGNMPTDDDDLDAYNLTAWIMVSTADSVLAGIPFLREISTARYGSGNTPIGSLMKDVFDVAVQASQGEVDEELVTTTISALGTALHLPSSQVNRAIEAFMADDPEWYEYFIGTRK